MKDWWRAWGSFAINFMNSVPNRGEWSGGGYGWNALSPAFSFCQSSCSSKLSWGFFEFYKGRGITRGVMYMSVCRPGCSFQAECFRTICVPPRNAFRSKRSGSFRDSGKGSSYNGAVKVIQHCGTGRKVRGRLRDSSKGRESRPVSSGKAPSWGGKKWSIGGRGEKNRKVVSKWKLL